MAFVDTGELGFFTLLQGWLVTVTNSAGANPNGGNDFQAGQWFRAAPYLESDNSPGVSIVIGDSGTANGRSGEAVSIDANGKVVVGLTVVNVGTGTAAIGINWLSAPQLGE
jgi:hypothetical protein